MGVAQKTDPASAGGSGIDIVAVVSYALALAVLAVGWQLRPQHYLTAEDGVGYWLVIIGCSIMLSLLLYPLRKRVRWMRF